MFAYMEYKLLGLAIGFAFFEGGRYERLAALILMVHTLYHLVVALLPDTFLPNLAFAGGHVVLAAALGWLALRHPARWALALLIVQLAEAALILWVVVDLSFYAKHLRPLAFSVGLLKPLWLSLAVARRVIGPPQRPAPVLQPRP